MNDMIEVKTADLTGTALDWAVAIAEHGKVFIYPDGGFYPPAGSVSLNDDDFSMHLNDGTPHSSQWWSPSTDWSQGGPLIEKHRICVTPEYEAQWHADLFRDDEEPLMSAEGDTPLIAACRAIVAIEFGEVVSVPSGLMR